MGRFNKSLRGELRIISPDHNEADAELAHIFGPAPPGGDVVIPPDNPHIGHQFSREETDAIAAEAVATISSGEWPSLYRETQMEAGVEPDDHPPLFY